tara:strand:- start:529 stop:1014 length:486 start_codon:yes stop_codon:yes gene_type:complete
MNKNTFDSDVILLIISLMLLGMTSYSQTPRSILESGQEISVTSNYTSYRHWDSQKEDYINNEEYLETTKLVFQDDAFYIQWNGEKEIVKQWMVFDERREASCRNCFLLEPVGDNYSNSVCINYCNDLITIYYEHMRYSDGSGRWTKLILFSRLDISFREGE